MIRWVRHFVFLALAALAVPVALRAQAYGDDWHASTKAVREAVQEVVAAQLLAIKDGDFEKAYGYATEGIKRRFTAPVFAALIRRGYPALIRHAESEMGLTRDDGADRAVVPVTVTDKMGRRTDYRYYLVHEKAGWRIDGVVADGPPPQADT